MSRRSAWSAAACLPGFEAAVINSVQGRTRDSRLSRDRLFVKLEPWIDSMELHGPPGLALSRHLVRLTEAQFGVGHSAPLQQFFFTFFFHGDGQPCKIARWPPHLYLKIFIIRVGDGNLP